MPVTSPLIESLKLAPPRYFPLEFIGGLAEMPCLFKAIGQDRCFPGGYSERISRLLPEVIRNLSCFLDRLTGIWRYEYGKPIALPTGGTIVGTPMFPEVERLFDVLGCSDWRLGADKLQAFLLRLTDPSRHEDALVEFAPVLRLSDSTAVQHEMCANEGGLTTIDWSIKAPGYPALLLEVKNRIRDLIESFEAMKHLHADEAVPAPRHDHGMLFRSVQHKFESRKPEETIQGVWIKSELMQEKAEFQSAFDALEFGRIHVAVLGDWENDAYVVATDAATKRNVLKILRLKHSTRLVFSR
jgi:hypothetical protein